MKVGVIDIGSNGIRFLAAEGSSYQDSQILFEERVGLRLGADAFHSGELSDETRWQFYKAMLSIRLLSQEIGVQKLRAVATSALRNSKNSTQVIKDVERITGISIDLISGSKEAALLKKVTDMALPRLAKNALTMDVGGGSVEYSKGAWGESLPLGTVRLLERCPGRRYEDFSLVLRPYLLRLRAQHSSNAKDLIGTGGNIRSLARLSHKLHLSTQKNHFTANAAAALVKKLFSMSFDERRKKLKLDHDRADVILPASCLLLETCRIFNIQKIHAPNVGLKNGLLLDILGR